MPVSDANWCQHKASVPAYSGHALVKLVGILAALKGLGRLEQFASEHQIVYLSLVVCSTDFQRPPAA